MARPCRRCRIVPGFHVRPRKSRADLPEFTNSPAAPRTPVACCTPPASKRRRHAIAANGSIHGERGDVSPPVDSYQETITGGLTFPRSPHEALASAQFLRSENRDCGKRASAAKSAGRRHGVCFPQTLGDATCNRPPLQSSSMPSPVLSLARIPVKHRQDGSPLHREPNPET